MPHEDDRDLQPRLRLVDVQPLSRTDIVAQAACMIIDALAFPRPSVQIARSLTNPRARVWTARLGPTSAVVGFLASEIGRRGLVISGLAVDPTLRRQGIARALLREAIAAAERLRASAVLLQVATQNRAAIALYQSEGFGARQLIRGYYAWGDDAYEMIRPRE